MSNKYSKFDNFGGEGLAAAAWIDALNKAPKATEIAQTPEAPAPVRGITFNCLPG